MSIPEEVVEEVKAATDIVEIVGDYVALKKKGANYFGLCPFHSEKTASFSVNPGLGIYKCFGCGAAGNVFKFVMELERIEFPECVRMLAQKAGIQIPEAGPASENAGRRESIHAALRATARFYHEMLAQSEAGRTAREYLARRGITRAFITRFGLGYAPDAWEGLAEMARAQHLTEDLLEAAGLIIARKDGGGFYDRFRHRLTFPIQSHMGKVLGFGARLLEDAPDQPKYLNSPETDVYQKSKVLYGLFQAKSEIRRTEEALLVEGYMDVIALHQAGIEHVVASSGTALTPDQVGILSRYAKRIVMLYDADPAGAAAAVRGIDLALSRALPVYAVALPPPHDPDSYVREVGAEAFLAYLARERKDFVAFKWAQARAAGALETAEGQAEAMRGIVDSIALVPDPLMQEAYVRRAGEVMGVPDIRLHEALRERARPRAPRPPAPAPRESGAPARPPAARADAPTRAALVEERELIRLILEHGAPMLEYVLSKMAVEEFSEGAPRATVQALLRQYAEDAFRREPFLDGSLGEDIQAFCTGAMLDRHEPSENWKRKANIHIPRMNEKPFEVAGSVMRNLKLDRLREVREQLKADMFALSQNGEDIRALQEEMLRLIDYERYIVSGAFLDEAEPTA